MSAAPAPAAARATLTAVACWQAAWTAEQRHALRCSKFGTFAERYCRLCIETHNATLKAAAATREARLLVGRAS